MRTIIAAPPGFLATDEELAEATGSAVAAGQNVFIGPDAPEDPPATYAWFETGLGDGSGFTLWIEDGQ